MDSVSGSELQSVFEVLKILQNLPTEFESRDWVINELCSRGIEKSVALWIGTNVKAKGGGGRFGWGFNLPVIQELFDDFCDTDMWSFLENYNGQGKIHFIRAGKNPSWTKEILDRFSTIQSNPNILLHQMPNVGHWIHAEDLNGMFQIIRKESGLQL